MSDLPSRSPTRGKHAWSAKKPQKQKSHRFATLLILGGAFVACIGLFIYFLFDNPSKPKTHLLYLQLSNHDSPGVTTIATVDEKDIANFASSLQIDKPIALTALGDQSTEVALRNATTELNLNSQDTLILYLRTQTLVSSNQDPDKRDALLITGDFNPKGDPPAISFTDVCTDLCKLNCSKIVILLDHSDIELSGDYALQVRNYSRDYLATWLKKWQSETSLPAQLANKLIVVSAKSDSQPSHISFATPTTPAKTLFFFALEKAATDTASEDAAKSSSIDGIPFADFFAKVYRYTRMGSGALQTPVLIAGKKEIDPTQLADPTLAFTLGNFSKSRLAELASKKTQDASDSSKQTERDSLKTSAKSPNQSSDQEEASSIEPLSGISAAWELAEKIQTQATIPPTDFAPHTWRNLLESLSTAELEQRVGTPVADIKSELDEKFKELQDLSTFLSNFKSAPPTPFDRSWQNFIKDPHFKAWTFDLTNPPENSPTYSYQPDDDLGYPVTRSLSRTFAQVASQFPDWLLFQHNYPLEKSRLETAVMQYLQTIILADGDWIKLLAGPTSLPPSERQVSRDILITAAKQLNARVKDEIERLESDIEMTRWQMHYHIHRLLQLTNLSVSDRQRLWKLAQKPFKELPAREPDATVLKLSETLPIGLGTIGSDAFLINTMSRDVNAIVSPTLEQGIQFSSDSMRQLTFMRTGTPEEFPIQVQRCDGTTPPESIEITVQGASDDKLALSLAGNSMPWNKATKVTLNNGRANLDLSALIESNPDLPQQISIQLTSADKTPENEISDVRNSHSLNLLWPLSNKFELYATIEGWSPINLSQGLPLLGAAVKNAEGALTTLSYQISIHNRSQLKRKALVQFYRVSDIRTEVKNPGSNRDRQREQLMSDTDALRLVDRWKPLLTQPLELDFPVNDSLKLKLPNSAQSNKANGNGDKKDITTENPWLSVPDGILCTVTELDQDRRPKSTDLCWISFDTIDPIDTQYKWLKESIPFRFDPQRKRLYFSANPTDIATQIPGVENIPIQIELQPLGEAKINKPLEVEPLISGLVERELPVADFADKPFLVHISLGSFPRQATYSFPDARTKDPQREPELTAVLGTPRIASSTSIPNEKEAESGEGKQILQPLPQMESDSIQRWVIDNSTDLTNTNLLVEIDAVFPFLQAYVGYTIRNATSDDLKKNDFFYEPIERRFDVRVNPEGKIDVQHHVDKWQIKTPAKLLFEEEGEYRIDLYRGLWSEKDSVTVEQLADPTDSRIIICDKKSPSPLRNGILLKDSEGKIIPKGTKLLRDKKYTIEITPADEGPGGKGVGIKKVIFGFDKNDDQNLSDDEIDPKITDQRNGDRWTAEIKVEQDSLRIVARTIDYANNSQDANCSERFEVSKAKATTEETANSPTSKLYKLTVDVRLATTGDPPSKPVELQLEGRSVSSQPDSHTFQYEKLPAGSYKAIARTTLGFDLYEVEETIEVSGKETSIQKQLKLQKKKPPIP